MKRNFLVVVMFLLVASLICLVSCSKSDVKTQTENKTNIQSEKNPSEIDAKSTEPSEPTELYSCSVADIYDDYGDVEGSVRYVTSNKPFECILKENNNSTLKLKYTVRFACYKGRCYLYFSFYDAEGRSLNLDNSNVEYELSIKSSAVPRELYYDDGDCEVVGDGGGGYALCVFCGAVEDSENRELFNALFSGDFKVVIRECNRKKTYSLGKVNTEGFLEALFGSGYVEGVKLNSEGKYAEAVKSFESIFNVDFCPSIPEYDNAKFEYYKQRLGEENAEIVHELDATRKGHEYLFNNYKVNDKYWDGGSHYYYHYDESSYINYGKGVKCYYEGDFAMACYYFGLCRELSSTMDTKKLKMPGVVDQRISLYNDGKYFEAFYSMLFGNESMLKHFFSMLDYPTSNYDRNGNTVYLAAGGGFSGDGYVGIGNKLHFKPIANVDGGLLFVDSFDTDDPFERYPDSKKAFNNLKFKKGMFALTPDEKKLYGFESKKNVFGFILDIAAYDIH